MAGPLQAEAWRPGRGETGACDLGRANALAAATWVIRCVRKTDKQRAVWVDGTSGNHPVLGPGSCRCVICLLAPCSCPPPWCPALSRRAADQEEERLLVAGERGSAEPYGADSERTEAWEKQKGVYGQGSVLQGSQPL